MSALIKTMLKPLSAISQKFILMTTFMNQLDKKTKSYQKNGKEFGLLTKKQVHKPIKKGHSIPLVRFQSSLND
jgi:hypothetical protein